MTRINQIQPWIGKEEIDSVVEYMESGGWLTEFTRTRDFEKMIADFVGSKYCSVLSNGTVTLITALLALDVGPGDEVIVPDFTMIASANAIQITGAKPVLVDITRENLCIDLDQIEEAVTSRTKAVMIVSINGRYPDMKHARTLSEKHSFAIVEDAAQSLGSRSNGKHLGTFGEIGSYSFSSPKIITTGQGGALVTDDESLHQRISMIKNFGRRRSGIDQQEMLGFNFKFTDLQAAIGIEQMKKLDWRVQRKKDMFAQYKTELANIPQVEFIETNLDDTSPWFVDVLVPDPHSLAAFLSDREIGTRPFYPPVHSQPPYSAEGDYPVSIDVSQHGLWLPSSSFLSNDDVERVCSAIRDFYA